MLQDYASEFVSWLRNDALPIWWQAGADRVNGGFVETIGLDGVATNATRRGRVQPRQVYCYALAGKLGWSGRLNKPINQLDGVVPGQDGKARLDVVQDGAAVVTLDRNAARGQSIETSRLEAQDGGAAAVPVNGDVRMAGGTLATADAQTGEAAGADGHRDAVEACEFHAGLVHHARDQRHQRFGVPARHGPALMRDHRRLTRVEHGGRAGRKRGVDGKDEHGSGISGQ